jgi:hypothetical protein
VPSRGSGGGAAIGLLAVWLVAACPRPRSATPAPSPLPPWQVELVTSGAISVGGIAVNDDGVVAVSVGATARTSAGTAELVPHGGGASLAVFAAGGEVLWAQRIDGKAGATAIDAEVAVVAVTGTPASEVRVGDQPVILRGEPGAALAAFAIADGSLTWTRVLGSTQWVVVRAVARTAAGGTVAVGSFAGTLRIGDRVVTSAGGSDGFVVQLAATGEADWLLRFGGDGADAATAVATTATGVVFGGSFTGTAGLRGLTLVAEDPRALGADGFVAVADDRGGAIWARTFGGPRDDAVAGVTVTNAGLIAACATFRGDVVVDGRAIATRGLADAAVVTFDDRGVRRGITVIGGGDYDSATAIAAAGDRLIVGAAYSGRVVVGDRTLDGDGGDGALVAALTSSGEVSRVYDLSGPGRETIAALAGVARGWAAVVRHTAGVRIDDWSAAAPADPHGGAALVFRGR